MNIIDMEEPMSAHFRLKEFLYSRTAERLGIPNIPLKCHILRIRNLTVNCLEPTRLQLCRPILITSGYRCEPLNRAVGGVSNSQHLMGEAADIQIARRWWPLSVGSEEQMARFLFNWMKEHIPYDQLILEHSRRGSWWVHVSCRIDMKKNRGQALQLMKE